MVNGINTNLGLYRVISTDNFGTSYEHDHVAASQEEAQKRWEEKHPKISWNLQRIAKVTEIDNHKIFFSKK